jgi:hypothetical protein
MRLKETSPDNKADRRALLDLRKHRAARAGR